MKFSERWLREWANPEVSAEVLAEQLTMLGLEVDAVAPAAPPLHDIVAGQVESIEKHPNADRLQVCVVQTGAAEPVTVVTGAPNVQVGQRYPYIGVGLKLPDGTRIKKARLRGIESSGMLCGGAELGLSDDTQGLFPLSEDTPPGTALNELLHPDDRIFTLSLTPNRGDCLSIRGIAREVAAVNRCELNTPASPEVAAVNAAARAVELTAAASCPRYVGRVIRNVDVSHPSPLWLREKLRRCGQRSLGVVVDVTNYVMLELGQPMHAFDNDKLEGGINVRHATPGEQLTLLDGSVRPLLEDTLVIADSKRAVALAGIMGGLDTAVGGDTRHLFLESAFFTAAAIAGRARQLGLRTDASHRFERGVDFSLQAHAIERATELLLALCGGEPGPLTEVVAAAHLPQRQLVELRSATVSRVLGKPVAKSECVDILSSLGLEQESEEQEDSRHFRVPPHRFDLEREADLIEEIARVHGYDKIPGRLPQVPTAMRPVDAGAGRHSLRHVLVERGYQEAVTYSFVSAELQSLLFPACDAVSLLNPISTEMDQMRVSLWPGLLTALRHNLNRQQQRVRLFETGRIFVREEAIEQRMVVGGVSYGSVLPAQWDAADRPGDFHDLKSDVEAMLAGCYGALQLAYRPVSLPSLHHGQAAELLHAGQRIGLLGVLHPGLQARLEFEGAVLLFEINLEAVPEQDLPKYKKISKFPAVGRDLSILVDASVPAQQLLDHVRATNPDWLTDLELLDVYQGQQVAAGKKSVMLGLTFQRFSDTLKDGEIDNIMNALLDSLEEEFGARLRV